MGSAMVYVCMARQVFAWPLDVRPVHNRHLMSDRLETWFVCFFQ